MDVFGYNGGGGGCFDYEKDHAKYPDMIMFASEVPHSLQTRGVYRTRTWYRDLKRNPNVERIDVPHLTDEELFTDFDEHYQSSYDNAMVRISAIDSWRRTRDLPYMCGEFRWTGFDYIGECYGWPCKSWNFGIIDLCGFPKDTFYLCQSEWTDKPMVHLLPHWTWPGLEGKAIPVIGYTNCDRVELFFNDQSLGAQDRDRDAMQLRWDVPYEPGTLRAVGYVGDQAVATCEHHTAGEPASLELGVAEQTIRADRTGIAHVEVAVVDEQGCFVPHAGPMVTFTVTGPGKLIGLENGDPLDTSNYKLNNRRAFHGRMLAIVQAGDEAGTITITARAKGLGETSCQVVAAKA
jgi:beta-galactosidase